MKKEIRGVLVLGPVLLALLAPTAQAKCRFACVAHKVTDLKALTLGLQAQLEEALERLDRQSTTLEALRGRVTALEAQGNETARWAANFQHCFGEVPISRYGQEQGPAGYIFQHEGPAGPESFPTTALDVTYDPDPVGAWLWVNVCNQERIEARSSLARDARRFRKTGDK